MSILGALRLNGIAQVYQSLGCAQAREIADYLRASPCYPGHVKVYGDGVARPFDETAEMTDVWCHDMETIVLAPYVWDLAISMLPTVARYLDARPHLYSMNAFWTRPSDAPPRVDLQSWHRDQDDSKFLALFIYGTDVLNEHDGPHLFKVGTHLGKDDGGIVHPVYGPAGTAFLADTRGLHMGLKPINRDPRLLIWARWGVSERPWSYGQDQLSPVDAGLLGDRYPADPETRDLVRLVAA